MRIRTVVAGLAVAAAIGCRPSDVLSVPAPSGVLASSALQSQAGAESAFDGAKAQLFSAADGYYGAGLLTWSGLLTDEFTFTAFTFDASDANIDARSTGYASGFRESGDSPWENLLQARASLLVAVPMLAQYEPGGGRSKVGEAYALAGYAELLVAESYCGGTPLDVVAAGGGIRYGSPLTTDSLLGVAVGHFDSAVANAAGDAAVSALAGVGLGRALLDRGQFNAAATAVGNVPTSLVYNVILQPNIVGAPFTPSLYSYGFANTYTRIFSVADQEGGTGLNFVSARDPRLVIDSTLPNADGGAWRIPAKFEADLAYIPLATGVEAALIGAEAALQASGTGWLTDLNVLRTDGTFTVPTPGDTVYNAGTGGVAGLAPLADPGTNDTRVNLLFRERAFWLFGTGTRLGDLRRLVRYYGRDQSTVFPTGPYTNGNSSNLPTPLPSYGTDVDLTLPTPASGIVITNLSYRGCIASTKTA